MDTKFSDSLIKIDHYKENTFEIAFWKTGAIFLRPPSANKSGIMQAMGSITAWPRENMEGPCNDMRTQDSNWQLNIHTDIHISI